VIALTDWAAGFADNEVDRGAGGAPPHRDNKKRMTTRRSTRIALIAGAALLMGLLVFLFAKTQSAEHKNYAESLALLRELRDLDARWDNDALRLANDLASDSA
jgi:hypothetical protein